MPTRIKKAMLLAAGYGTRLKPLTNHTPKPLVPVAGRPMIEYALDKLRAYGVEEMVINVSHLKAQLVDYFAAEKNLRVTISEEAVPLETGGGLKKAAPFLGEEPVFAINSDILWTDEIPSLAGAGEGGRRPDEGRGVKTALNRLAQHWDDAKMDFLLLAQSKAQAIGHDKGEDHLFIKPENTFGWNADDAPYIISGIGIFHPRVLRDAPDGKFSVKVLWLRALAQNRLFCLPHHGRWFQTGTLDDIRKTEEKLKHSPL
jgi:MurNAc alpha-1-phosphate uridylyltransferase